MFHSASRCHVVQATSSKEIQTSFVQLRPVAGSWALVYGLGQVSTFAPHTTCSFTSVLYLDSRNLGLGKHNILNPDTAYGGNAGVMGAGMYALTASVLV